MGQNPVLKSIIKTGSDTNEDMEFNYSVMILVSNIITWIFQFFFYINIYIMLFN